MNIPEPPVETPKLKTIAKISIAWGSVICAVIIALIVTFSFHNSQKKQVSIDKYITNSSQADMEKAEAAVRRNMGLSGQSPSTYTIKPGDTLWDISKRVYGDPTLWPAIWANNNMGNSSYFRDGSIVDGNILRLPDTLDIGDEITIPNIVADDDERRSISYEYYQLYNLYTLKDPIRAIGFLSVSYIRDSEAYRNGAITADPEVMKHISNIILGKE